MTEWISVDERMPELYPSTGYSKDVLATDGAWVGEAFYHAKGQWRTAEAGKKLDGVTHWMPLPKPPEAPL